MKANEAQLIASNEHRSVGFGQPLRRFQRNLAAAQQHDIATPECHALRRQGGFELLPWRAVIVRKFSALKPTMSMSTARATIGGRSSTPYQLGSPMKYCPDKS
jgi:hypothetical protein